MTIPTLETLLNNTMPTPMQDTFQATNGYPTPDNTVQVVDLPNNVNALNIKHRKENNYVGGYSVIAFCPELKGNIRADIYPYQKAMVEVLTLRFYNTGTRLYGCLWIPSINLSSSAWCDGGGYHMESAVLHEVYRNAGITLTHRIDSVGDQAVEESLKSIADKLGFEHFFLLKTHG